MHASLDIPPYFFIRDRSPVMPPTERAEASTSEGGPEGWNRIQGAFWREGLVSPDFEFEKVTHKVKRRVKLKAKEGARIAEYLAKQPWKE